MDTVTGGTVITMTNFDLIERDVWTKSGSLGKMTWPTTCSGISNVKSWSSLNERMVIVMCHGVMSETSL
jgi:hypothetical protein